MFTDNPTISCRARIRSRRPLTIERPRLLLPRYEMQDIDFVAVVPVRHTSHDFIAFDPEVIELLQHSVAARIVDRALHHYKASRLQRADDLSHLDERHGPTENDQVEPLLPKIVLAIRDCRRVQLEPEL